MTDNLINGPVEKPSFLAFLRRNKQKQSNNDNQGGNSSSSPDGGSNSDKSQSAKDKAQVRRAQVRRAQIQHRQRKANYVKQLELDIGQLREMVNQIQRDTRTIQFENDDMRAVLLSHGVLNPPGLSSDATSQPTTTSLARTPPSADQDITQMVADLHSFPAPALPIDRDITVTLSNDKIMGTPSFKVSPSPSSPSAMDDPVDHSWGASTVQITPIQETLIVNFILALEHCCWDHFFPGDCHHHREQNEEEHGHALMATSCVMAAAPESIYQDRQGFSARFRSSPTFQWQTPPVTLDSLYGLAQSIETGDAEFTPIQAWFELARRYPVDYLIRNLDRIRREFKGVVRCVAYGAAIEKSAFESIAYRVLGPAPTLEFGEA